MVEILGVQNSADPTVKNKLGETPSGKKKIVCVIEKRRYVMCILIGELDLTFACHMHLDNMSLSKDLHLFGIICTDQKNHYALEVKGKGSS